MARVVDRPQLTLAERLFLPAILAGLGITMRHIISTITGRRKVTMQYPEEKWDEHLPDNYRGAPSLVSDEQGRARCVACQLCEFICPSHAITVTPEAIPADDKWAKVEKRPAEFHIDMLRCIYCGYCQEVCPEQAIFMSKEYSLVNYSRPALVNDKKTLLEIGGVRKGLVNKWNENK